VRERGTCCSSQEAERAPARHATEEGAVRRREGSKKALLEEGRMASSEAEAAPLAKVELAFKTGSGKEAEPWTVREFWMRERLGRPYHGFVDIVTDRQNVDFSALLAKPCVLELRRGPDRVRRFHGLVFKVEHRGAHAGSALARVGMAAAVHALSYGQNSRMFEDATAVEIIEKVLKVGLEPFGRKVRLNLVRKYAKREYTTQHQEDDLSFVQRLMVDEGVTFHFEQGQDSETLVLVDSNYSFPRIKTMKKPEPASMPLRAPAADAPNLVEVELTDEDGTSVPFAPFTIRQADGKAREVRLDRSGWARVPIAKDTSCELAFRELDESEWKAKSSRGEPKIERAAEGGKEYVVKQGDCLSSIAYQHGLPWEKAWNHPNNKDLRELRKDPNVLYPGDRVFVPGHQLRWETCVSGAKNCFVRTRSAKRLQFALKGADGAARAGLTFSIEIDGGRVSLSGTTDGQGIVACEVPPNAQRGRLTVEDGGEKEHYDLLFGHLDPVSEISGIQARLNHLGFWCGAPDGKLSPRTSAAIARFQEANGLHPTGDLDDGTRNVLMDAYGA
jgi:N-acetylmuramoyl-L-alanine amidase